MNGLPKRHCKECQSTAEFNHCYLNSGCDTIKQYCNEFCVHSEYYIKMFGRRDSNRIKRKLGLM